MFEIFKAQFSNIWLQFAEKPGHAADVEPQMGRRLLITKGLAASTVVLLGLSIADTAEARRIRRRRRRKHVCRTTKCKRAMELVRNPYGPGRPTNATKTPTSKKK